MHSALEIRYISADRESSGWSRPCSHEHRTIADADRCAMTRSANIIVSDPDGAAGEPAILTAPHIISRKAMAAARPRFELIAGGRSQYAAGKPQNDPGRGSGTTDSPKNAI